MEGTAREGAAELLALLACLAPEAVPFELLDQDGDTVPEPLRGVLADEGRRRALVDDLTRQGRLRATPVPGKHG